MYGRKLDHLSCQMNHCIHLQVVLQIRNHQFQAKKLLPKKH